MFFIQIFLIVGFALAALRLGQAALITWVTVQALIANLFVLKQITLFGFHVTASDAFAIGSLLGLNLLQEYFQPADVRKATWVCFFFMLFFTVVSQLHLLYQPSIHDSSQNAFMTLLAPAPRLLIASISVFLFVQQFDIRFFALLKRIFPHVNFALRVALSLAVSQLLDTILFSFLGLYGLVASVFDIIVVSFAIKLIVISCFTPIVKLAKT
ncbi:MAG: queuosine precursor transporter [Parachlamydiaceae bacterium]|nr:queuosine precursor transporter [Parachlamydiaceae bacterium]